MTNKDRAERLCRDSRLRWLMETREFHAALGKLSRMIELDKYDEEYIQKAEIHIENIYPHIEKIIVNGEEVDVLFTTRTK